MSTTEIADQNGGTITIRVLRDRLKLRGVPQQGVGFFSSYYAFFRGRAVMLNSSSNSSGNYGLFSAINTFFNATSVLYLGCEAGRGDGNTATGSHIEAAVLSPSVLSLEAVCSDPERYSLASWGSTLTRSLAKQQNSVKDASRFRIEMQLSSPPQRDRDLVVHYLDDLFPPAASPQSVAAAQKFLLEAHGAARRLQMGGFYVLVAPASYNGIDFLLSAIASTTSPDKPLKYVGMLLYGNDLPLWVFRNEPVNAATLESQRTMAVDRLSRYPPVLQRVVNDMMPKVTEVGTGMEASFEEVLATRVTPTDTLASLFRLVGGFHPREVLNRLSAFQPKYSSVIDSAKGISDLKIQIGIIVELLYDLALASQRGCSRRRG